MCPASRQHVYTQAPQRSLARPCHVEGSALYIVPNIPSCLLSFPTAHHGFPLPFASALSSLGPDCGQPHDKSLTFICPTRLARGSPGEQMKTSSGLRNRPLFPQTFSDHKTRDCSVVQASSMCLGRMQCLQIHEIQRNGLFHCYTQH